MKPHKILLLRKIILPILKKLSRDIEIKHPWLDNKKLITLNSFKHKGYWYHGKRREEKSMKLFSKIVLPNSNVIEVGGHIGFISLFFEKLNATSGMVYVFEPGSNNLPYIEKNISNSIRIELIKKAIGDKQGIVEFYEDDLTGQNNSVVEDFQGLKNNQKFSFVKSKTTKVQVPITTLDHEFQDKKVDFIKIDIEGGEWAAICGAQKIISQQKPAIMVEVQANEKEIFSKLSELNYVLFDEEMHILTEKSQLKSNVFCLHKEKHKQLINKLKLLPN